jgi:hypothetical protein
VQGLTEILEVATADIEHVYFRLNIDSGDPRRLTRSSQRFDSVRETLKRILIKTLLSHRKFLRFPPQ